MDGNGQIDVNFRIICCVIAVICIFSCVLKQQNINKKPPISRDIIVEGRARWFHQALTRLFLSHFSFVLNIDSRHISNVISNI